MGKVPTRADDSLVLWESAAILCYLASQRPGNTLFPTEPRAQADALRWLFFCSCHVDPYLTTLVVERFVKMRRGVAGDEAQASAAEQCLARFVPIVDKQLAGRQYVTGRFGVADIALGCTIELAPTVKLDLGPYANLRAWLDRLAARPSWR
jgi:glutathione S-transferase